MNNPPVLSDEEIQKEFKDYLFGAEGWRPALQRIIELQRDDTYRRTRQDTTNLNTRPHLTLSGQ